MTVAELVEEIEKFSALSEPDIRGVIIALENVIKKKLADGHIVRFEQLGSLYLSISSSPAEKEDKLTDDNIKNAKVNYRINEAMQATPKHKIKA